MSSGLSVVSNLLDDLAQQGFGPERVAVVGFSQGACLAVEAATRLARPFRPVATLSGGLVGTGEAGGAPRADLDDRQGKTFDYEGRLKGCCHVNGPEIAGSLIWG